MDGLVDPFTGDFHYSIPLFNLPGPQGTYPFAINYRSSIQTEQESSWVGLGWTFEPGRISRSVRGLPDDIAGDDIHQLFHQREGTVYGGTGTIGVEIFGLDSRLLNIGANVGLDISFDTYSGYGMGLLLSAGAGVKVNDGLGANLGVSADLNTHHGTTVGSTLGLDVGMTKLNPSFGASYNATTGLESAYWGYGNVPLFSPAYVAASQRSQWGDRVDFSVKIGGELWGVFLEGKVSGYHSTTRYGLPAVQRGYGYLHLHEATNRDAAQLDFVREKDSPLKPDTPYLPFTTLGSDTFEMATSGGAGGAFRAYRNDIPLVGDPLVGSSNVSFREAVEIGSGALAHVGVSGQLATGASESSGWRPSEFESPLSGFSPRERTYFALLSEHTTETAIVHSDEPQFIELPSTTTASGTLGGLSARTTAMPLSVEERTRGTQIRSITEGDLADTSLAPLFRKHAPPAGLSDERIAGFEVTTQDGTRYVFGQAAYVHKEINCTFSVDPVSSGFVDGQTTVKIPLGLEGPLNTWYNTPSSATTLSLPTTTDQFLTCISTAPHAHSYHLTAVLGPNYRDLAGDGPSDDDLGHWVRFEYVKVGNYAYRSPYYGAHYSRGFEHSYLGDDRGSFTYGRKDLFFVARAVTASHQALFAMSERAGGGALQAADIGKAKQCDASDSFWSGSPAGRTDARGAAGVVQNPPQGNAAAAFGVAQPRLLGAFLCRRGETTPIRSVFFDHDYQLAGGVPNSDSGGGKLTLTRLSFEHGADASGRRSPYEFDYHGANSADNPKYQDSRRYGDKNADRWGYYQKCRPLASHPGAPAGDTRCSNGDAPYTRQVSQPGNEAHENSAAWSLRSIVTPSGARIEVDYEPDDYAFVQDEKAAVLMPASSFDGNACGQTVPTAELLQDAQLCVDLATLGLVGAPTTHAEGTRLADALLTNAGGSIPAVAFSAEMRLRTGLSVIGDMWQPISGYVVIASWQVDAGCGVGRCPLYLHLVPSTAKGVAYHPLAFAAWQHLKLNQPQYAIPGVSPPDIDQSDKAQLKSQAQGLLQMVVRLKDVFDNFAERASDEGWGDQARNIKLRLFHPSGRKRGGGVRTREIRLCEGTSCAGAAPGLAIGKSYTYLMGDETVLGGQRISSGVAAYEPSLGGDEISARHPVFFNEKRVAAPSDPTYFELPIAESLYPAPVVGYRRVVERTLASALAEGWRTSHPELPPLSLAGERVHEFFTAKDFPVRAATSVIQKPTPVQDVSTTIGIGTTLQEEFAASQGFRVELNDMHGRPRRVTEYALKPDGSRADGADRQTTYFYNTAAARLDPTLPAVHDGGHAGGGHRKLSPATLGQRVEYYADMRRSVSSTNSDGVNVNLDVMQFGPWPVPIPVPWPSYDDSVKESRTSVFHQVVHRNSVLLAVETRDRSTATRTDHLAFDHRRGAPILTSQTNAFGDPVFDLRVPAYWLHPRMAEAPMNQIASDAVQLRSATNPFNAPEARCCEPSGLKTLEVPGVLAASATVFANAGLVDNDLLFRHAPLLREGVWEPVYHMDSLWPTAWWRPIVTYRFEDSRKYARAPSPRTDGRYAHAVAVPISAFPESDPPASTGAAAAQFVERLTAFDDMVESCAPRWKRTERFRGYHPRGPAVHSYTPLGGEDAVLYGHSAAVIQAVARNAGYSDIGFEGFESYAPGKALTLDDLDDGNIDFWTVFDESPEIVVQQALPGNIRDGVIVWQERWNPALIEKPYIDPLPPDMLVRVDSYLGDAFVIRPQISKLERRGRQAAATPRDPLGFTDRDVVVNTTKVAKVVGVVPAHLAAGYAWLNDGKKGRKPRVEVTAATAHTGAKSLSVNGDVVYGQTRLRPTRTGTFVLGAWVSVQNPIGPTLASAAAETALERRLGIGVVVGGSATENPDTRETETSGGVSAFFEPVGPVIDGWQRIEGEFAYDVGEAFTIFIQSGDRGRIYVDDVRIFPKDASLQTFVYEPRTQRLIARLDDNNIATRWQYDQDGQLRFAERETERGWRSVREHIDHQAELQPTTVRAP